MLYDLVFFKETVISYSDEYFNDGESTYLNTHYDDLGDDSKCYISSMDGTELINMCKLGLKKSETNIIKRCYPCYYWIRIREILPVDTESSEGSEGSEGPESSEGGKLYLITGEPAAMKRLSEIDINNVFTEIKVNKVIGNHTWPVSLDLEF